MNHKTKRFWILLVSSFLVIMNLSNVNANGSEPQSSPTETTDKVTVLETLFEKKGAGDMWQSIPSGSGFSIGEVIRLSINWEISEGNLKDVKAGDYFNLVLDERMSTINTQEEQLIANGVEIGTWRIDKHTIVTTLNETGASSLFIHHGFFHVYFTVDQVEEGLILVIDGKEFGPFDVVQRESSGGREPIGEDLEIINKDGGQIDYTKVLNWTIEINR